jgi:hypothetical protein
VRYGLVVILVALGLTSACSVKEGVFPEAGADRRGTDGAAEAPDAARDVPADASRDQIPEAAPDIARDVPRDGGPGEAVADAAAEPGPADGRSTDAAADAPLADTGADVALPPDSAADLGPVLVRLSFTGKVLTVAGSPLGLSSSVINMPVSGSFAYDLRVPDDKPTDPQRGLYKHYGTSQFTFVLAGHTVEGSGNAFVETEDNLPPDTFRFRDGFQLNDPIVRIMKLDGVDAPSLVLLIAITDTTGAMLSSDAEPNPFPTVPFPSTPHTFSIDDGSSTLLMQLDSLGP